MTDAAEKLTPEAIPAAAAALKGKERDPSEAHDNGVVEGECIHLISVNVLLDNFISFQSAHASTATLPFSSACSTFLQPKLVPPLPTSV
jgi:hypothetical protein